MGMETAIFHLYAGASRGCCGVGGQLGQRDHIAGDAHPEDAPAESPGARQLELGRSGSPGAPAQAGP
jgi:hypothetical protein